METPRSLLDLPVQVSDKVTPPSLLDLPVHVSDDGNVIFVKTDIEQRDLDYDADKTGWQGRSIRISSIGGRELRAPLSSTVLRHTSTTKEARHHRLRRAAAATASAVSRMRQHDGVAEVGDAFAADDEADFADEGDTDDEECFSITQLNLARVLHTHVHDLALTRRTLMQKTEIGGAELGGTELVGAAELGGADLPTRISVIHDVADDNGLKGRRWDDDDEEEAVQQESCALMFTLMCREDASAPGRTYDDINKSPPPHLRCVGSPLSSLPTVLRCIASSRPWFLSPTFRG